MAQDGPGWAKIAWVHLDPSGSISPHLNPYAPIQRSLRVQLAAWPTAQGARAVPSRDRAAQ
eukprot:11172960-Alexandrium_andersonii.AAC.1